MNVSQFHEDYLPPIERQYPAEFTRKEKPRFRMVIWAPLVRIYCLLEPLNEAARDLNIKRIIVQPKHIYP